VEANRKFNDILIEANKLKLACEEFEKKILPEHLQTRFLKAQKLTPEKSKEDNVESLGNSNSQLAEMADKEEVKSTSPDSPGSGTKPPGSLRPQKHIYNAQQFKDAMTKNENNLYVLAWGNGDDNVAKEISTLLVESKGIVGLEIGFGYKKITNKGVKTVCTALEKLKDLKMLKFWLGGGNNKVTNEGLKNIAVSLNGLQNLTHFALLLGGGSNQITDESVKDLGKALENLVNLVYLDISFGGGKNNVTDEGAIAIANAMSKLTELKIIKLWFWNEAKGGQNQVSDEGLKAMATSLSRLINISEVLFSFEGGNNQIYDEGMAALGNALTNLPLLDNVWINSEKGNNKVSESVKTQLEEICQKCKEKKIFI